MDRQSPLNAVDPLTTYDMRQTGMHPSSTAPGTMKMSGLHLSIGGGVGGKQRTQLHNKVDVT